MDGCLHIPDAKKALGKWGGREKKREKCVWGGGGINRVKEILFLADRDAPSMGLLFLPILHPV